MRAALEAWEARERRRARSTRGSGGREARGREAPHVPRCRPTGLRALDASLPGYGLPLREMTELSGESWGDRVALALRILGEATRRGTRVAYVDGRRAIQPAVAQAFGVEPERLLLASPRDSLQGLKTAEVALGSGLFSVVALDLRLPVVASKAARLDGLLRRLTVAAERGRAVGIWLADKPWPLSAALRLEVAAARRGVRVRRLSEDGARSPAWKVPLQPETTSCAAEGD